MELPRVVFLPGAIQPAAIQYQPLLAALQAEIHPILKDLELYRDETPPPNYQLGDEVEALKRMVDESGLASFHLVGYSGGGAVALAFTAVYPDRVKTLALTEPAVIPSAEWMRQERDFMAEQDRVMALPPADLMPAFVRVNLRPGVVPPLPPQGPPPPWMTKRPAGLRALMQAFNTYDLDLNLFRRFHRPVYLAIGSLTNAIEERKAKVMTELFAHFRLEVYEGRHHFDPPQRAEPARFAQALRQLWITAKTLESG